MLERLSIRQKFRLLSMIAVVSFFFATVLVWTTLYTVKVNGPLYEKVVQSQNLVADVLPPPGNLLESYLVALQLRQDLSSQGRERLFGELSRLHREFIDSDHLPTSVEFPAIILYEKQLADADADVFFNIAFNNFRRALTQGDMIEADASLTKLSSAYKDQRAHLLRLIDGARAYKVATEQSARQRIVIMSVLLLALGLSVIVAYTLTLRRVENSIANPIDELLGIIRKVLAGDWQIRSEAHASDDEIGELLLAIRKIVETTQAELVKAEKMAALGALVAGISHELNTPVGNCLMAVTTVDGELQRFREAAQQGLKRTSLTHFVHAVGLGVEIALRNLERTAELLRSFKQVAVDRSTSQRRKFLLGQVVSDTLTLMQPRLIQKNCSILIDIESEMEIDGYPGPLGQVLSNLIENAVSHGFENQDGGVLEIRASTTSAQRVRITVRDNGCGMAAEIQSCIFDPFFTTKMGCGGTGLGLHIVHNIVHQLLGGEIVVRSELGSGSEFELIVPLTASSASSPSQ